MELVSITPPEVRAHSWKRFIVRRKLKLDAKEFPNQGYTSRDVRKGEEGILGRWLCGTWYCEVLIGDEILVLYIPTQLNPRLLKIE